MSASVTALFRYPIKGMTAERLDRVELEAGRGFPLDRVWGLARADGAFDPADPKPLPKTHFVMLMRDEGLAAIRSRLEADETLVLEREGREPVRAALKEAEGRRVVASEVAGALGFAEPPTLASAGPHRFTDVSVVSEAMMHAVSLLNLASVRELGRRAGVEIDPARFRMNLHFDGMEPFEELDWVGREVEAGPVRMRVVLRTRRCAATEVDPATARRDLPVPRLIREHLGHTDMGVYAEVVAGGTLRVGDGLRLA